ncbi:hypothetical protein BH11PSE9_BH11PSE9_02500 [soil metagenome]
MSHDSPADPRPITEARLLAMINASGDSFWETDVDRRFVHLSDNMCRMMGYPREQLHGRSVLEFMTPEYGAEVVRQAQARAGEDASLAHAGPIRHEGEFFRRDGARIWIETVSVPVFDDDGRHIGYFGITREATERKRAELSLLEANRQLEVQLRRIHELHEQMREHAIRDDLTGLHNRRHFVAVAEHELERARSHGAELSLVMVDIDHFKTVNDMHGHPTGDVALKAFGAVLAAATQPGDVACRLGGEEFGMLLVGSAHDAALARAEACRAAVAEMVIPADGNALRLTASFGVATFPGHALAMVELMKLADTRMYRAKDLGRNRVVGAGVVGAGVAGSGVAGNGAARAE